MTVKLQMNFKNLLSTKPIFMKKVIRYFLFLILQSIFFLRISFSQSTYLPLGNNVYHIMDRREILDDSLAHEVHTVVKPYLRKQLVEYAERVWDNRNPISAKDRRNLYYLFKDNSEWSVNQVDSKKPILKYFYTNPADLYSVQQQNFFLKVNPVILWQGGKESDTTLNLYTNTKGLEIRGAVDNRVGFYFFFTDNQMLPPKFVQQRVNGFQAFPGEGFYKNFKDTLGFDYISARGYIDFGITKNIAVQFGHDKNFIGNGYRSLFLSDYSNSYFFLKLNTRIWKLNYQNVFAELTNQYLRGADTVLPKKYLAVHHLSINLTKRLNIGFFESVVFGRGKGSYELQYINPVIFYRAIEQGLGSPDNANIGMDFKLNFLKHFSWYGQLLIDELNFQEIKKNFTWWGNKYGVQSGLKWIDVFGIQNLDLQGEFNSVRPFTYTHFNSYSNYTHYNQSLAHPLGANFNEVIGIARYQPYLKWMITAKIIGASYGADSSSSNWGGNIFMDYTTRQQEFGNKITQGIKTNLLLADFTVSFMFRHNLFLDLKYIFRNEDSALDIRDSHTQYIGAALRLNIAQKNFDF